jgi:hypothetical protein
MSVKFLIALSVTSAVSIVQLHAQSHNRFAFNVGGGVTAPLNPTAAYSGVSGNFLLGAGYNINNKSSIMGEFMWNGLPPNLFILHPVEAPTGKMNLYSLTANYRRHIENIRGSLFGLYLVGGGGWYYRYTSIDKNYVVPPATACLPIYGWWGYACDAGYVYSTKVAYKGSSAGGLNGGFGFTIRLSDSGWKFFAESRYHYAWTERVRTTLVPVTLGLRLN